MGLTGYEACALHNQLWPQFVSLIQKRPQGLKTLPGEEPIIFIAINKGRSLAEIQDLVNKGADLDDRFDVSRRGEKWKPDVKSSSFRCALGYGVPDIALWILEQKPHFLNETLRGVPNLCAAVYNSHLHHVLVRCMVKMGADRSATADISIMQDGTHLANAFWRGKKLYQEELLNCEDILLRIGEGLAPTQEQAKRARELREFHQTVYEWLDPSKPIPNLDPISLRPLVPAPADARADAADADRKERNDRLVG